MDIKKLAKLASLQLTTKEEKQLKQQLEETIKAVSVLGELDTSGITLKEK